MTNSNWKTENNFEKWFISTQEIEQSLMPSGGPFAKFTSGEYISYKTKLAWDAWNAGIDDYTEFLSKQLEIIQGEINV